MGDELHAKQSTCKFASLALTDSHLRKGEYLEEAQSFCPLTSLSPARRVEKTSRKVPSSPPLGFTASLPQPSQPANTRSSTTLPLLGTLFIYPCSQPFQLPHLFISK